MIASQRFQKLSRFCSSICCSIFAHLLNSDVISDENSSYFLLSIFSYWKIFLFCLLFLGPLDVCSSVSHLVEIIRWSLFVMYSASVIMGLSRSSKSSWLHHISSIWLCADGPIHVGEVMLWKSSRLVALALDRLTNRGNFLSLFRFALKSPRIIIFQLWCFASRYHSNTFVCVLSHSCLWFVGR